MASRWSERAAVLRAQAAGWEGIWSLLYAAGQAGLRLAATPGGDDDLGLTYARLDISFALTEVESLNPGLAESAAVVDLGPGGAEDRNDALTVMDDLLARGEKLAVGRMGREDADVSDLLCAARVVALLASARAKASGGAW